MRHRNLLALCLSLGSACVDAGPAPYDWGKSSGPATSENAANGASGASDPGAFDPGESAAETDPAAQDDAGASEPAQPALDAGASESDAGAVRSSDAAVEPRRDAGSPRADAGSRSDSASPAPQADAATMDDPAFAGLSVCTSRMTWRGGDNGGAEMYPGRACNECHSRSRGEEEAPPIYAIAGTLYPTGHEPDNCYGAHPGGATVHVVDARGQTLDLQPNTAGNFTSNAALTYPLQVSVQYQGRVRMMEGPVERGQGDCNTCHTEMGTNDAPGRIALP